MEAWAYVGVGLVILLLGGDVLVKGAVNLALRLGIPALIVSITVVAFGTSAPELLIAIEAVLDGAPGLALGNVVGSNTANVLLVLGIPAIIATLDTSECDSRKTYIQMMAGSALFVALCFSGLLVWWHGLILLAALTYVLGSQFAEAQAHRAAGEPVEEEEDLEGADPDMPGWKVGGLLVLGLAALPLGASLLVEGAEDIARKFGMSEAAIGLTLVALGTSLPELATTVMAAIRREADVAIGNVIGSNVFNLLAIIGVAVLIGPIPVGPKFLYFDLWVMLAASLALVPFVFLRWKIGRTAGIVLTTLYVAYIFLVLT
ncbi:MAG: calcium/sodium antiporter [Pseudomonadota bacterium]